MMARRSGLAALGWEPQRTSTPIGVVDTWGVAWPQYLEPLPCAVTDGACLTYNAALGPYNDALHRDYEAERAFRACQYDLERNNLARAASGLDPLADDCRVRWPDLSIPALPAVPPGQTAPAVSPGGIYGGELAPYLANQPVQLPPAGPVVTVTTSGGAAPVVPVTAGPPAAAGPVDVVNQFAGQLGLPPWALFAMGGLVLVLLAGGRR